MSKVNNFNYIKEETKRFKDVDEQKVSKYTKGMLDILKLKSHEDVVKEVTKYLTNEYTVYSDKLWTVIVPKNSKHRHMPFVSAHTDTVRDIHPKAFSYTDEKEKYICNKEKDLCGADDRLGCWIIQQLIKDDSQDFIFGLFDQEEVGVVGSSAFIESDTFTKIESLVSCYLGLDRKGYNEMASYGYESTEFLEILGTINGWEEDMGSFTDVAALAEASSLSCVNFSIGGYNEHGENEKFSPEECVNTLNMMKALPRELWDTQYICENNYNSYGVADDYWYSDTPTVCKYCGETLYTEREIENQMCEYCLAAEDKICSYCGDITNDTYNDEHGNNLCYSCFASFFLQTNKEFCAFLVLQIAEKCKNMLYHTEEEINSCMRCVNLISYFSKFDKLKDDQIEKVNAICKQYDLPFYPKDV